ncbi:NUDIX hydrolase [Paucibacter sp. DJ2R-2]|uniref:NUDIX hydrolase n=1 Tax=Paucibacter sp. DJ2R-2 TaxID=2893558 RepID=UPI0021E4EC3B|nr:CoA pyrophosphatase [Paucibacter sp. DJ2R-2]MCV2420844.1 CoA pyrophosphatase [Paucibacter sp. DJ4R-1]MCV2440043.1 CoA pyrophosphatase [Paucibacter sp. DJ2R-2]
MSRAPILDPRAVPVTQVDTDLPPVAGDRLTATALRQRFARPPTWQPELAGDGGRFSEREPAAAAVLLPLVERADGLHLLLTRRTEHLRNHAGQISLPGGKTEASDPDASATALRETEEEIGLARRHIEVLGSLPIYTTVTSFLVTPVVALVQTGFELRLDHGEVDEAFEVPLQFLMTPAHHRHHRFEFAGGQRQFLSMPWSGLAGERDDFIWGATAAILRNFYRFLSA